MTNSHLKQTIGLAAAVALALVILSGEASAQDRRAGPATPAADTNYLRDVNGNVPKSGFGLCWHTAYGPVSSTWTMGCDPALVPTPVAMVYVPAPVVAASRQRLTFDADAFFDFDKSALRPAGRATLDNFVYRIKDINPEQIVVIGHADRVGTDSYNQGLSERRAESVKTYLIAQGIAPYRVQASGVGEKQEATGPYECLNNMSARAVACRQPDRHVDIDLIGARIPN